MENYFNYFTEIEERYQKRRGTGLLLSTLDWALIETWKDAGIPLEAVLRGIDSTFDTYDRRPVKTKKINSLAYCAQEILAAAEDMKEAAVGTTRQTDETDEAEGLESREICAFLRRNAARLRQAAGVPQLQAHAAEFAETLNTLAGTIEEKSAPLRLEDLERHLTVLEEKLIAVLIVNAPDTMLLAARTEADREIAPYRSKMPSTQIEQLQKQFVQKRLFEQFKIPRLSLFYL